MKHEGIFRASVMEREELYKSLPRNNAELRNKKRCPLCTAPIPDENVKQYTCDVCLSELVKIDGIWFPRSRIE